MAKKSEASAKTRLIEKPGFQSLIASLIAILGGFVVGFILLVLLAVFNDQIDFYEAIEGIGKILAGPFSAGTSTGVLFQTGNMLFNSTVLIMTGLSVAIAFKTGLFNIGAPGQYLMGAMGTMLVALSIPTDKVPSAIVWILALLTGILCGALWGAIPGLFKGFLGVNEVIICIMTNWIAANIVSWVFKDSNFINVAETKMNFLKKTSANGVATATLGLDKLFAGGSEYSRPYLDISIFIAALIAIGVYIMMTKTTFGFELRACGFNRNASKYAGMNEKRNIVLSMAIAGALAACGAALWCLNGNQDFKWEVYQTLPNDGFNGISVALLANSNPIGVIFSAIFLRYVNAGGANLAAQTSFNEYVSQLIIAVIIYFAGFSLFIREVVIMGKAKKKAAEELLAKKQPETEPPKPAEQPENAGKEAEK